MDEPTEQSDSLELSMMLLVQVGLGRHDVRYSLVLARVVL